MIGLGTKESCIMSFTWLADLEVVFYVSTGPSAS